MRNASKYAPAFFPVENPRAAWAQRTHIDRAPRWCSVDLRDGNQALPAPMHLEDKLEYFRLLVSLGFKEIEVGFPAASDTEYRFIRRLIDDDLIPDDVTIQVITQAREHIIRRTFDSLRGAKRAVVHLYSSVSRAFREQVFEKSEEETALLATGGAALIRSLADEHPDTRFTFEFSPESFPAAEPHYALSVIRRTLDAWQPSPDRPAIVNIPSTVSLASPHIFANSVEYILENIRGIPATTLSVHTHNDRGTAVAEAELALLAGAERVEGCLFTLGERTGNCDLVTLALNLYSQGVDPHLNLENLPAVAERFEHLTRTTVGERQPYAGSLVFAAFSGSHQDAIAKGLRWREAHPDEPWSVPYLPLDPADIGERAGADVIRINSQSGGGGAAFLLERAYGFRLPKKMRRDFGAAVGRRSDKLGVELTQNDLYNLFLSRYAPSENTPLALIDCHYERPCTGDSRLTAAVEVTLRGAKLRLTGSGNGRLDAVADALRRGIGLDFTLDDYSEHALGAGSTARAAAYVGVTVNGHEFWGVGIENDIIFASIHALLNALNAALQPKEVRPC